ncbi:MAG: SPFH domain-containing protein [Bacilli bacterium]|nr:SPFH domain-containing protein [Bacilli bacterium]
MGLIKSAYKSISSTLHDQWEEYITCDSLDNNTLVVKKTTENGVISNKSRIQVAPGQVALIFDSGKILDATAEEGIYTFDSSTSPSLFAGDFGGMFKEMWERFKFNGATSKEQAVFYVNTKEIIDNKFGSSSPMAYPDPEYKNIYIRYYGVYSFKITDPFAFVSNIAGNVSDKYTKDELMEQANAEFVSALDVSLQNCASEGVVFSSLPSKQLLIAKHMNEALDESWKQLRGMEVVSVAIEKITPDDESRERIQKFDNASMYGRSEYATGRMVDATASAMENAASNANGAGTGFMGLGMMNGAMGSIVGNPLEYVKKNEEMKEKEVSKPINETTCSNCGSQENGNFCSKCGNKLERNKYCSKCGNLITGNFCSNCGTKVD